MSTITQLLLGSMVAKGGSGGLSSLASRAVLDSSPESKVKAWNLDPRDLDNAVRDQHDDDHPGAGGIGFDGLRGLAMMSTTAPFTNLRIGQIAVCSERKVDKFSPGTDIVLRDPKASPTAQDLRDIEEVWAVLERDGGYVDKMKMAGRDSVILDAFCAEVVDKGGKPYAWYPQDAATIRWAKPKDSEIEAGRYLPSMRKLVQWADDRIVNVWNQKNFIYGVRNPRTDTYVKGYGYPELAQAADVISDLLFAKNYNSLYFKNGVHASTILTLTAKMKPEQFRSWKRLFHAQLKGVENAHRMAAILLNPGDGQLNPGEQLSKLDLTQSNRDMEFSLYYDFMYDILAAITGVDRAEVGLGRQNVKQNPNAEQKTPAGVLLGRERGLTPMLNSIAHFINKGIVWRINPRLKLVITGFGGPSQEETLSLAAAKAKIVPLNRVLRLLDEEPLPYRWADEVPMDPIAVQLYQLERQGALDKQKPDEDPGAVDWSNPGHWVAQGAKPQSQAPRLQAPRSPLPRPQGQGMEG